MLCQECQKRPASVHLTQIVNNQQSALHLCELCAQEKGALTFKAHPPFSIHNLLAGLLGMEVPPACPAADTAARVQCDNCGLTYAQFGQIGRFGCSSCYGAFNIRLLPLFRRVHGSAQHVGKLPSRAGGLFKMRRDIEDLRRQLQEHVTREEFEQAAVVRDRLRQQERELAGGGSDGGL
ncbi:MAG: UvrB/UvrC motif-containing protein [Dethiobacter sp.]|nr:UvrB/UvrC motif-containing protein [Dethiobacter sp.]